MLTKTFLLHGHSRVIFAALAIASAAAEGIFPAYAIAQSVAPSQLTPRDIAPPRPVPHLDTDLGPPDESVSSEASGDERLGIFIGTVNLDGAFAEMAAANANFVASLNQRTLLLSQVFAAARRLEQAYAQKGYVFARIVVPPQRLSAGSTVRVAVIDGFVEAVDLSQVPAAIRTAVGQRISPLVGVTHLTGPQLERALLLAGELSGVTLRSALTPGEKPGGVRLVIEGKLERVRARFGADNNLPASLGTWQFNGNLVVNNLLGIGDQAYLFAGSEFGLARLGRGKPRLGVIGAGMSLPVSPKGTRIGGEVLLSRTEPDHIAAAPQTTGNFERAQFSISQPLVRTRHRWLDGRLSLDLISQSLAAPDFATTLNLDRYAVLRFNLAWLEQTGSQSRSLDLTLSQGLTGREASALVPYSRAGTRTDFTNLQVAARFSVPLVLGFSGNFFARSQSSFGKPLFLSEQFALDGDNAVSSVVSGSFNVDSGATLRGELLPAPATLLGMTIAPYAFAAGGVGVAEQPTAAEQRLFKAGAIGFGGRVSFKGLPGLRQALASIRFEVSHQFSNVPGRRDANRGSVTGSVAF